MLDLQIRFLEMNFQLGCCHGEATTLMLSVACFHQVGVFLPKEEKVKIFYD
jgi:hypothetical protein